MYKKLLFPAGGAQFHMHWMLQEVIHTASKKRLHTSRHRAQTVSGAPGTLAVKKVSCLLHAVMALHRTLLVLSVAVVSVAAHGSQRTKRGLLELAGAIQCSTGRSALSYMMYGCYCGLGGQGWPRDRADWCCHKHDCCYGDAELLNCKAKTHRYDWTCEDSNAECEDLEDKCEKFLCKCDREAAKCLRKAPYIQKYALWPDFMCGSEHPTCNMY